MRCCLPIVTFVCLSLLCGCAKDDRMKRQASLLNAKTQTAQTELAAAPTAEAKAEVAKEYFADAPQMTQVISDYMFGRTPQTPTVGGLPNATKGVGNKLKRFFLGKPICTCE